MQICIHDCYFCYIALGNHLKMEIKAYNINSNSISNNTPTNAVGVVNALTCMDWNMSAKYTRKTYTTTLDGIYVLTFLNFPFKLFFILRHFTSVVYFALHTMATL